MYHKVIVAGNLGRNPGMRLSGQETMGARASYEVTAETVRFLGGRDSVAPGEPLDTLEEPPADVEEEIPF